MMLGVAARAAEGRVAVVGTTATRSPPIIVTAEALADAGAEVVALGVAGEAGCLGIIVSAFGDPGVEELRERVSVPVIGLCEASMIAAAQGGRRFGVATVSPDLLAAVSAQARRLGLAGLYTGARCSGLDAAVLTRDAAALEAVLAREIAACIEDGAEAVIIGGGPLGEAAESLAGRFGVPVISPIACAVRYVVARVCVA